MAIAVVAFMSLGGAQALARPVHCGEVIPQDTKLDSDLTNCPGDGIVIGADNITLDLTGHTVDGSGSGSGIVARGVTGVTIEDGTVQEFGFGISLAGSDGNHISGNFVSKSNFSGISLEYSNGNLVERNATADNHVAIAMENSDGNDIEKNSSSHDAVAIATNGSDGNLIAQNSSSGDTSAGLELYSSNNNQVEKNLVSEYGNYYGILLFASAGNRVNANSVLGGGYYGIAIKGFPSISSENLLLKNTANGNAESGLEVDVPNNTLTRNIANDNEEFGIEAVPGVIDGGGNKASGNGDPLQCLNIACK